MPSWEDKFIEEVNWSRSPAEDSQPSYSGSGAVLYRGIVTKIKPNGKTVQLQNTTEDEENYIKYSFHGDKDGKWNILYPGDILEFNKDIYILNDSKASIIELPVLVK